MDAQRPSIAVVGSGPSGCYAAQFLRKKWPAAEIVIFEALPVPYGLVRYGVAPDHQGNKSVIQQFDRLFEREDVRFVGNVVIGTDISFDDLRTAFDVVILATGLANDRRLEIDGDLEHCPVIGAGSLLKALNGHPLHDCPKDSTGSPRHLGRTVAVVGNGNVAMDVVRLLAKRDEHFVGSDIADVRLRHLCTERITHIDIVGRSPAASAKFDFSMLKEIVGLPHVQVAATGLGDDKTSIFLAGLKSDSSAAKGCGAVNVCFHFNARPSAVQHKDGVSVLTIEQRSARCFEVQVDTIISAIGFEEPASTGAQWDGPNVFRVGWLNTGGKGAIAANRRDAKDVVDAIGQAVESGRLLIGTATSGPVWAERVANRAVAFNEWRKIDRWELANALAGRCRQKILDVSRMIDVAAS